MVYVRTLTLLLALFALGAVVTPVRAADALLVEAESFESHGGWKLDTQFIEIMGSPYLLAHGLGRPVADATTTVTLPGAGTYRVFVRTKDWTARWGVDGKPGRFQLLVNGKALGETFGTKGSKWQWHDGGTVDVDTAKATLTLRDLTGFDGRCDAIYFTKDVDGTPPPNEGAILPGWRRDLLGLKEEPTRKDGYDLVVIGGGYSGMGAAISAARQGIKVALIQNRPVLGGNGSSEVRVWAMGHIRRGPYPAVGEIVHEFADNAKKSPGTYEEFEDAKKEAIVRAEKNIDLFLNHHAYKVDTDSDTKQITGVYAFDTRTSEHKRFVAPLYVDCTGHGTIGHLAGADWDMTPKGRMGMSNMWAWGELDKKAEFPDTSSWALDLKMKDFPYPRKHHGQWFWESGFDKDPIHEAEYIRDWNLRAVYGAFNAMKNRDGADDHETAILTWVAFIGGPRESRRLMGDVVLTQEDIVTKRQFPDGCVPSTWSIDLHYPKKQYAQKFPDDPFISIAKHDRRVDRNYGYPVPYRCFYSRNVPNLFMAGRCISVTHEALGTVRVMKTCGMMGEVVGKAAAVATEHNCSPREVYEKYWDQMDVLLKKPGAMRRDTLDGEFYLPKDAPKLAPPKQYGGGVTTAKGIDVKKLPGIVIDDRQAKLTGEWGTGPGSLTTFVAYGYRYSASGNASARYEFKAPESGKYEVRVSYAHHENRGKTVPVTIVSADGEKTVRVDMSKKAPLEHGFISVGTYTFEKGTPGTVTISAAGAGGHAHADAVQFLPVK